MSIYELYSTRNKAKYPDVYQYTEVSKKLRNQVAQILIATIGNETYGTPNPAGEMYNNIYNILKREYGEFSLGRHVTGSSDWLHDYLVSDIQLEAFLDVLELACRFINDNVRDNWKQFHFFASSSQKPDDAITELNERMKLAGFGYEFTDGIIIRINEQYIHAEVVKPALLILQDFEGAQAEFLSAHKHYLQSNFEECIIDCCKSFESLMKAICYEKGWINDAEQQRLTAAPLIKKCIENKLVPLYLQNQFNAFQQLLDSGVPTVRNKTASHGTGRCVRQISQGLVSYTLHLTATNIVFLGNCYHEMKGDHAHK